MSSKHHDYGFEQLQLFGCIPASEDTQAPSATVLGQTDVRPNLRLVGTAHGFKGGRSSEQSIDLPMIEARLIRRTRFF
jgi:hypothetical protein